MVKRVLKPDGCFMFSMIGGTTLPELRVSMVLAELEREGGVGAHIGPFVELSDVGTLLQNAGFALPTIDIDTIRISYPNAAVVMEHLQRMGEGNASLRRRDHTGKDTFLAAACIYDEMFPVGSEEQEGEKDVEASAQVIYAIGWSPDASQQKPKQRGSAKHRIGEMVTEHKSGDSS
jgi:NADH dehydrogenase [ubiquinone] 1 alpha subcomplex assembly factor 5